MASKYTDPELLVTEWVGPFRLDQAPEVCDVEQLGEAVYVVFGRHKSASFWPLWFETRWVKTAIGNRRFKTSSRPTRMPLQYIGIGKDPCVRADAEAHEHLSKLDARRSFVWYAKPVVQVDPSRKTEVGWPTAVFALEKCLIFLTKPRRNKSEKEKSSAPLLTAWCRLPHASCLTPGERRMARRLPVGIRFDPNGEASIEFHARIPEKHVSLEVRGGTIVN